MHSADSTVADLAHAAGVSLPTFEATRGHLVRGDILKSPARTPSAIDNRMPPVRPLVQIGPLDC